MKTSQVPLVSPGTRLVASEVKATKRPSGLIAGLEALPPSPSFPALSTLTRSVAPADAPVGVARRARTPERRPTAATMREPVIHRSPVRMSLLLRDGCRRDAQVFTEQEAFP